MESELTIPFSAARINRSGIHTRLSLKGRWTFLNVATHSLDANTDWDFHEENLCSGMRSASKLTGQKCIWGLGQ